MVELCKVAKQIVRQVDYYFGDLNLSRDQFLKDKIKECEGGWIPMEIMLKFKRLSVLANGDANVIMKALKESKGELMELDEENSSIRRKPDIPIPELTEELKAQRQAATLYVGGFDKDTPDTDDIFEFFETVAKNVICVDRRNWRSKTDNTKGFKGSCFVLFKTKDDAEAFMESKEGLRYKEGAPLIKKWMKDYFTDKSKEYEEKRRQRKEKKGENKAPSTRTDDIKIKVEPMELPKGSVLVMESLGDDTSREDFKETLNAKFDVKPEDIAFIYFERGQPSAQLRFRNENGAKEVYEKILKDEDFKIKDTKVETRLLEGEEEEKFLAKCAQDMQNQRKRKNFGGRGGRGGRGGKRKRFN